MRLGERQILTHGPVVCGVLAALLALSSALTRGAGATVLSIQLSIATAVIAIISVVLTRRAAAVGRFRRLDPIQRAGLLEELRQTPTLPITVSAPRGDAEAITFAGELLDVLRAAQWPVTGIRLDATLGNAANAGLMIAVSPFGAEPPKNEAHLLFDALERVGLAPVMIMSDRLRDQTSLELFVGRRPG
jgi:hypothetical protein